MVADRALSLGSVQATNSGQGKIFKLCPKWYALLAGHVTFAEKFIQSVQGTVQHTPAIRDSIVSMRTCLEDSYRQCRQREIENQILFPQLMTADLLTARPASLLPLPNGHYSSLIKAINDFDTQTNVMICGFDANGCPHIMTIAEPGTCLSFDSLGYHAVGIGAEAALVRLAGMDTDRNEPVGKIIYGVFDAKVSTEIFQGISYEWDGEVLARGKDSAQKVPRPLIATLDRVYRAFPRSPFDDTFKEPRGWWKKLDAYARRIIPNTNTPLAHHVRTAKK